MDEKTVIAVLGEDECIYTIGDETIRIHRDDDPSVAAETVLLALGYHIEIADE